MICKICSPRVAFPQLIELKYSMCENCLIDIRNQSLKGGITKMFKIDGESENEDDKTISLHESRDGTGINIVLNLPNGKKHYIARILHDGTLKVFTRNPSNVGLRVDEEGRIKIIKQVIEQGV